MGNTMLLVEKVVRVCGKAGAWLVIPLNAVVLYEVFIRYILNKPTDWVYDTAWMLFSALFLLGGGWVLQEGRHVRIDIILGALPNKLRLWWEIIFYAVMLLPVMAILTWKGIEYATYAWVTGERLSTTTWGFPSGPVKTMIPLGFGLVFLQGILELIKVCKRLNEKEG
ncbi:MAG: TRAP transporter small permease subunit [Synergistetes bacterium]|nr:MAG: Putative membrane protein [bacterium 42_11]MBC7331468.1 TRAP transporter small permease subunit [Synergistota bacterium]